MCRVGSATLKKVAGLALDATFLVVHILVRFRNCFESGTPDIEENRVVAEWVETRQKWIALQNELDRPTVSRLHGSQTKLIEATKTAKDKCHDLVVKLRTYQLRDGVKKLVQRRRA
jgi:hypothetical protein